MDISKIPMNELLEDRDASLFDINLCEFALARNITEYGDSASVQSRLESNRKIVEIIDAELARREQDK